MSYIPDCRTDEYYNEKFLGKPDKDFINGFDWCVEMAVDNFFGNDMFDLALPETRLGHVLCEELPEDMREKYEQEHVFLNDGENEPRKVKTYADLIRYKLSGMDFLRLIGAGIAAVFTYIFGGADNWLVGLAVLVVADYISGVIAAYIRNELNSKRGFAGILKKILLFCVVAVANIILYDREPTYDLNLPDFLSYSIDNATNAGGVLRSLSMGFLMANEGISVLENAERCGVRLPARLIKALEQLRGEDGEPSGNENKPPSDGEGGKQDEPYNNDGSGD